MTTICAYSYGPSRDDLFDAIVRALKDADRSRDVLASSIADYVCSGFDPSNFVTSYKIARDDASRFNRVLGLLLSSNSNSVH